MNKTKNIIWVITIIILSILVAIFFNIKGQEQKNKPIQPMFTDETTLVSDNFSDGLHNPDSVITYPLGPDGVGISEKSIYLSDINQDGKPDKITKTFHENGNAHSYYEYTIEIATDKGYKDITPENFKTVNGADCDLQQIQFKFKPKFSAILIYREMGDTWSQPTIAHKQVFTWAHNKLKASEPIQIRSICDVKELF